jgi:N-acetylneuraminate synthase
VSFGPTQGERSSLVFRRSIYVVSDLQAGSVLTRDNLRCIRPGLGLAPKYLEALLGKRVVCDVRKGTPMSWQLVGG